MGSAQTWQRGPPRLVVWRSREGSALGSSSLPEVDIFAERRSVQGPARESPGQDWGLRFAGWRSSGATGGLEDALGKL